jgi:hypothetical protein
LRDERAASRRISKYFGGTKPNQKAHQINPLLEALWPHVRYAIGRATPSFETRERGRSTRTRAIARRARLMEPSTNANLPRDRNDRRENSHQCGWAVRWLGRPPYATDKLQAVRRAFTQGVAANFARPITLRCIIALPMMQLFLFGFALNTDPKNLPAGLLSVDHSKYERTLIAALQNTGAERGLAEGELLFVITIPPNFDRSVDRGDAPSVFIDADASDPTAVANATAALPALSTALNRDLPPIRQVEPPPPPFQIIVHARYNPERLTVLNVVPGLICIV